MKQLQHITSSAEAREEAKADRAFHFPQGMAGFPEAVHFAFLYDGHGDITCLQSMDSPEIAFLLTPWDEERLGTPPAFNDEQRSCLQLADDDDPFWMVVLNPFADTAWVTANARAPVAINVEGRVGLQCIRPEEELPLRMPWMPQPQREA